MLTPSTTSPVYITPSQHTSLTSTTPSSFQEIPPIIRWCSDALGEGASDFERGNVVDAQGEVEVGLSPSDGWDAWPSSGSASGSTGTVKGKLWVTEASVFDFGFLALLPSFLSS